MRVSALIQRATNALDTAEDLPPTSVIQIWLWQRHTESFKPSAVSKSGHLDKRRKAQEWTFSYFCSRSALDKPLRKTLTSHKQVMEYQGRY